MFRTIANAKGKYKCNHYLSSLFISKITSSVFYKIRLDKLITTS